MQDNQQVWDVFSEPHEQQEGRKEYIETLYNTLLSPHGYKYVKSQLKCFLVGHTIPATEYHVTLKNLGEELLRDIAEASPEHFKRLSFELRQEENNR